MDRFVCSAICAALGAFAAAPALAQDYPAKAIRVVVPFSPGGATDILTRLLSTKMSEQIGRPVVVENRAGGGGNIGADYVAKSAPDGYTLLAAGIPQAIGQSLFKDVPYNMERDLAPITMFATFPSVIAVHPSLPVKSVKELLQLARTRPGALNFGAVPGSPNHLAIELLKVLGKVNMVHIPYKGGGPVVIDVVAGHIHVASMGLPPAVKMVEAGKLRPLAVTSATRSAVLKDVPTVQESGVRDYEVTSWYGMFAPARTPEPIVKRLHTELSTALKAPDVTQRLGGLGAEASGKDPDEFARHVREEIRKWAGVVKASGAPRR
ncbi:MAG TPA: tripartite tricarboxylate transporter substrate binding protein [Burkholderiales bacterium]|nr:tripartite tricarboxylate transporter substrate binding protein [Burkholderiales bacterium]